jgi:hypothetical protein
MPECHPCNFQHNPQWLTAGDENKCGVDDATESWLSKYTNKGTEVKVTLCFKARFVDEGRKLIPIRE